MPLPVVRAGGRADLDRCVALACLAAPERSARDWRDSLLRDVEHPEHHLAVAER